MKKGSPDYRAQAEKASRRRALERRVREDPVELVSAYLVHFRVGRDGLTQLGEAPLDEAVLELVAERLHAWLNGKMSLDAAFDITGRGRGQSARDRRLTRKRDEALRYGCKWLLDEERRNRTITRAISTPAERALARTANMFGLSEEGARKVVRRRRHPA